MIIDNVGILVFADHQVARRHHAEIVAIIIGGGVGGFVEQVELVCRAVDARFQAVDLAIFGGTTIRIIADGTDEQAAVDGLVKLVNSGFSE